MNTGGFPVDLVLFGMIAAFLVLRLRSILGRRTGFERPPQFQAPQAGAPIGTPVIEGRAEPASPPAAGRTLPNPSTPLGETLMRMKALDPSFDPAAFLDGAERAFRLIVGGFASGDRASLRPLLSEDVFRSFDQAIAAREAAGHVQVSEIRAVPTAAIETAELRGTDAHIGVRFVSDQVSLTHDSAGQPVAGTDAVTEITDIWTFERALRTSDPTWRVVAVRGA